jgi:hypothetical protein
MLEIGSVQAIFVDVVTFFVETSTKIAVKSPFLMLIWASYACRITTGSYSF